jgi:hypothetical protein
LHGGILTWPAGQYQSECVSVKKYTSPEGSEKFRFAVADKTVSEIPGFPNSVQYYSSHRPVSADLYLHKRGGGHRAYRLFSPQRPRAPSIIRARVTSHETRRPGSIRAGPAVLDGGTK